MADVPWWAGAATTGFGVVLGFGLNAIRDVFRDAQERRGHLLAIRRDILLCCSAAQGYLDGGVGVPASRMPLRAAEVSLPALLMSELIDEPDARKLSAFFNTVKTYNVCLDYAQAAIDSDGVDREVRRAHLKAKKLLPERSGAPSQYDEALEVVTRHLFLRTGHRILFWKQLA